MPLSRRVAPWLGATITALMLTILLPSVASAATLRIELDDYETGTAPFDANSLPGNDASKDNDVIRTNDQITYRWAVSANNGSSPNTTIRQTLPAGATWTDLPNYCLTSGVTPQSSLSTDRRTITCNIGTQSSAAKDLYPTARIGAPLKNGDRLSTNATISSSDPGTPPVTSNTVVDVVSSQPRVNLIKQSYAASPHTRNGQVGALVEYWIQLAVENVNGKGTRGYEPPVQPLKFVDDISAVTRNTSLVGCSTSDNPVSPSGGGVSGVTQSGVMTCTQPGGKGTEISVSVSGADLTGAHTPTQTRSGDPLPADKLYLGVYAIQLFVPNDDIPVGGMNITNTLTKFDPNGASGESNFGAGHEPLADNSARLLLQKQSTASGLYLSKRFYRPETGVDFDPNDGVAPGETFRSRQLLAVPSPGSTGRVALCDMFDTSTLELSGNPTGEITKAAGQNGFTIQYGTGGTRGHTDAAWAGTPGPRTDDCSNSSSPGGWHSAPGQVQGGAAAVTKVRLVSNQPLPAGALVQMHIGFRARATDPRNGAVLQTGTILSNFLKYSLSYGGAGGDNWSNNSYNPRLDSPVSEGARVVLSRAKVAIEKDTAPASIVNVSGGDVVTFRLRPTVTNPAKTGGVADDVVVTDTLPAGYAYQTGSASLTPTSVTSQPGGMTTLRWILGDRTINQQISDITYKVLVDPTTPNATNLVNTAVISSPIDVRGESFRLDRHTLHVNRVSGILITKTTSTPWIEPGDDMKFEVVYTNNSPSDLPSMTSIDVLPFLGDGRFSAFAGQARLEKVDTFDGELVEYTNAPAASVSDDPHHASNRSGGSTKWCPQVQLGSAGCPAGLASVTAVRVSNKQRVLVGESQSYKLTLATVGNRSGDVYANDAGLAGETVTLPAFSRPVEVKVVASKLGDVVWQDRDFDGIQEAGEPGVAGVKVRLTGTDKDGTAVSREATTDAAGRYQFAAAGGRPDLRSGAYRITFTAPAGYVLTRRDAGSNDAVDSDAERASGQTSQITIASPVPNKQDQEDLRWDAGLVKLGSLSGHVYEDADRNDDREPTEALFPDVEVTLTGTDVLGNAVKETKRTNADGRYEFTGLLPGKYEVKDSTPAGYEAVSAQVGSRLGTEVDLDHISDISLDQGDAAVDYDFGKAKPVPPTEPEPPTTERTPPPTTTTPVVDTKPSGDVPAPPVGRLAIDKRALTRNAEAGAAVRFRITVTNVGGTTVRNVRICDKPGRGLVLVTVNGARMSKGSACWTVAELAPGQTVTKTITARTYRTAPAGRCVKNMAQVTATGIKRLADTAKLCVKRATRPTHQSQGGATG